MLDKLANILTGGLADTIMGTIEKYFPPDMSDQQKAALKLSLDKLELEKNKEANRATNEAEMALNDRIAAHEGTARDLMSLPVVGRIIIFARGAQRPVWGYATLWGDFMWLSGKWSGLTEMQESALWVINLLVLGFLFGERAVKNVTPLIAQYFGKK